MKTLPNSSKAMLAAAAVTVLFAAGCERRAPEGEATTPPAATAPAVPETSAAPATPTTAEVKDATANTGVAVDDAVVTTKVKTAFLADSDVKGLDINVDTAKGVVTLNGAVDNQTQIDRAVKIAGETKDVVSVTNNLTIKK